MQLTQVKKRFRILDNTVIERHSRIWTNINLILNFHGFITVPVFSVNKASRLIVGNLFLIVGNWKNAWGPSRLSTPTFPSPSTHSSTSSACPFLNHCQRNNPAWDGGKYWFRAAIASRDVSCRGRPLLQTHGTRVIREHLWNGRRLARLHTNIQTNKPVSWLTFAARCRQPFFLSRTFLHARCVQRDEKPAGCWHVTLSPHTKHHTRDVYTAVPEPPLFTPCPSSFYFVAAQQGTQFQRPG